MTAFGVLADVATGYPVLLTEMTILTALRTAATSALAAKHLAPAGARTMAIIGNGAQCGVPGAGVQGAARHRRRLRLYDIDPAATAKCARNLAGTGLGVVVLPQRRGGGARAPRSSPPCTADKTNATILTDNMVGAGVHINAVGGDCPGKTELHADILLRARHLRRVPAADAHRGRDPAARRPTIR